MAQKRQYREAANLLQAVHQLSTHFAAYHKVPKIKDLRLNVERTKEELTHQILDDFAKISRLAEVEMSAVNDEDGDGYPNGGGAAEALASLGLQVRE